MTSKLYFARRDFDNDREERSIPLAVGVDKASASALLTLMEDWLIGASGGSGFFDEIAPDPKVRSTQPASQNSLQAIIEVVDDTTGNTHTYRMPSPDMNKADDGGTNPAFLTAGGFTVFNPVHADYVALKSAIETKILSKDGNAVTLSRIFIEE